MATRKSLVTEATAVMRVKFKEHPFTVKERRKRVEARGDRKLRG